MISVVIYGRNDDYGYNLHKRAAISLNCIASTLTEEDEILFVDYNTPDEFPTFPEAIRDTLTERARTLIKVLRVRERTHREHFAHATHLAAVEPVARNVGVRRSNPTNRWVLSTNTDIILLTHSGRPLTEEVGALPDGFYCAPRVEVPEAVWETFDRTDPEATMRDLRVLRRSLHLDEIVHGTPTARYDAPGDFQLALREDLFAIGGFHEGMLKGWHVDSNLSARLLVHRGSVEDAGRFVIGYHCDHLRKLTPMHAAGAVENDLGVFVDAVTDATVPGNGADWGLADVDIEEFRLDPSPNSSRSLAALAALLEPALGEPYEGSISPKIPDSVPAPARHVVPFVASVIDPLPRSTVATWIGPRDELHGLLATHWTESGFRHPIAGWSDRSDSAQAADDPLVFLHFGSPALVTGRPASRVMVEFNELVMAELERRASGLRPSRVIVLNGIYNRFEPLVRAHFRSGRSPFSTRVSVGVLRDDAEPPLMMLPGSSVTSWTRLLVAGPAGRITSRGPWRAPVITARPGVRGHVFYGPRQFLPVGECVVEARLTLLPSAVLRSPRAYVDVAIEEHPVAAVRVPVGLRIGPRDVRVPFSVHEDQAADVIEVRLHTNGRIRIRTREILIRRTA